MHWGHWALVTKRGVKAAILSGKIRIGIHLGWNGRQLTNNCIAEKWSYGNHRFRDVLDLVLFAPSLREMDTRARVVKHVSQACYISLNVYTYVSYFQNNDPAL